MRDILFRGKRVDNGEWIEGLVTRQFRKATDKPLLSAITSNIFGVGEQQVDTNTLGQYVGLTDKNGKKIFEGDMLGVFNNIKIEIYFDKQYCQFRARESSGFNRPIDYYCGYPIRVEYEIIGNIYDTPELFLDAKMRYKYGMRLRGYSLGCQPINGLVCRENSGGSKYYDILVYNRRLTEAECKNYELDYLGEEN